MKIGTREVGPGQPVFIIAEIGSNHAGSLDLALTLIDEAAKAGADAAKFQYFRVDRFLVPRPDPEALRKYELPDEWLSRLKARCEERGVEFLCTAFDRESHEAIRPFVNAWKVGSAEAQEVDLRSWGFGGKPLIMSDGYGPRLVFKPDYWMRCISRYPSRIDSYLRSPMEQGWSGWGVSDHTIDPFTVPCAAVALGACVVEKHMTLAGHYSAIEPSSIIESDFASMVHAIRKTERAIR